METTYNSRIKLSPNELENLIKAERMKWRKFRIQQVRAQSMDEARRLKEVAQKEEEKQKIIIRNKLKKEWEEKNKRKLEHLEQQYEKGLQEFGDAHRKARLEVCAIERHKVKQINEAKVAKERGRKALQELNKKKIEDAENQNKTKLQKKKIIQQENRRAKKVAKLPTPPRLKLKRKLPHKVPKKVTFHEAGTHTTSRYTPTKVEIIKEKPESKGSAREVAERETEKLKQVEEEKKKKEIEQEKKTQERAKTALKKERTREIYSELMTGLEEAEANHRLCRRLREEELQIGQTSKLKMSEESKNDKEKEAEQRAKVILDRERYVPEIIPIEIGSGLEDSSLLTKGSDTTVSGGEEDNRESGRVVISNIHEQDQEREDQVDDSRNLADNIHFKKTVPIHEMPIIKDKFILKSRKIPFHASSSSTSISSSQSDPSRYESSFDEINIRIKIDDSSARSSSSRIGDGSRMLSSKTSLSSPETEYSKSADSGSSVCKIDSRTSSQTVSSKSTEYYKIPESKPMVDKEDDLIFKNLKSIEESRNKVQKLIDDLQTKAESETEYRGKEFQTFKTPPRIYTEEIKGESSSKRPLSRRQKFEECKKAIIGHYLRRLMKMKEDELKQISSSSVEGSEVSMSKESYLKDLWEIINEYGKESPASSANDESSKKYSDKYRDIDTVPTKMSSSSSSQVINPSLLSTPNLLSSSSSAPFSSTPIESDSELREQIYTRLLQLQKLKQEVILKRQGILAKSALKPEKRRSTFNEETSSETGSSYQTVERKSSIGDYNSDGSTSNEYGTESGGLTLSWNTPLPSEEIKYDDLSRYSTIEKSQTKPKVHEIEEKLQSSERKKFSPYEESPTGFDDEMKTLSDSMKRLYFSATGIKGILKNHQNSPSTDKSSYDESDISMSVKDSLQSNSKQDDVKTSSSATSLSTVPDMGKILEKFGLGWARSMIKKMDDAEKQCSSDSSVMT